MQIILVRHADAENTITSDFARKLTDKGHKQSKKLARYLSEICIKADVILTSPLVRAKETAEYLNKKLSPEIFTEDETLACGMHPEDACSLIRSQPEDAGSIIMVGHEPDLSSLAAYLCGMRDSLNFKMKKCACAIFETDTAGKGKCVLNMLVSPNYLG